MTTRTVEYIDLPTPSPGTHRSLKVIRYGTPGARPKAYLQTGLHADENPGMLAMNYLDRQLRDADGEGRISGEVILVPVANPIGLNQHVLGHLLGRYELDSGQNFNRCYPNLSEAIGDAVADGLNGDAEHNVALIRQTMIALVAEIAAASELDTLRKILVGLGCDADICLDLHCDSEAILYMFTAESLWPDAQDLAAQIGAQVTLLADLSGGDPFDEAIGGVWWGLAHRFPQHPIPAACLSSTIELRGRMDVTEEYAQLDSKNLFRFLVRRGVLNGDPGPLPQLRAPATPFQAVDKIIAPCSGLVVYEKAPGDLVNPGEVVARIVDPLSEPGVDNDAVLTSRVRGTMYARRSDRITFPGQVLCHIAGDKPLPDRIPGKLLSD